MEPGCKPHDIDRLWKSQGAMNDHSKERLAKVHPELAARVERAALVLAAEGIHIEVVQGLRTYAEQDALYAQGRTKSGKIVTKAVGGFSNHNFGLAVDVCPFVDGKPAWNAAESVWQAIGAAGKQAGLDWGGGWKSFQDKPHLELPGLTLSECRKLYPIGLEAVWAEAAKRL